MFLHKYAATQTMHRELAFNFHGNRLFTSFSELFTCNSAQSCTTFHMKMTLIFLQASSLSNCIYQTYFHTNVVHLGLNCFKIEGKKKVLYNYLSVRVLSTVNKQTNITNRTEIC